MVAMFFGTIVHQLRWPVLFRQLASRIKVDLLTSLRYRPRQLYFDAVSSCWLGWPPRAGGKGLRPSLRGRSAAYRAGPLSVPRLAPISVVCRLQSAACTAPPTASMGRLDPVRMIPQLGQPSMGHQRECVVSSRSAPSRTWLASRSGYRLRRGAPCQEHGANATEMSCVCRPWCRHPMRPFRAACARSPQSRWCPGCKPTGASCLKAAPETLPATARDAPPLLRLMGSAPLQRPPAFPAQRRVQALTVAGAVVISDWPRRARLVGCF